MSLPGTSRTLGDVLWREAIRGPISLSTPWFASGSCIAVKPATPGGDDLQQYYLRLSSTSFDCAKWRSVHGKEINPCKIIVLNLNSIQALRELSGELLIGGA